MLDGSQFLCAGFRARTGAGKCVLSLIVSFSTVSFSGLIRYFIKAL